MKRKGRLSEVEYVTEDRRMPEDKHYEWKKERCSKKTVEEGNTRAPFMPHWGLSERNFGGNSQNWTDLRSPSCSSESGHQGRSGAVNCANGGALSKGDGERLKTTTPKTYNYKMIQIHYKKVKYAGIFKYYLKLQTDDCFH